jgi:hypothetical protein
MNSESRVADVVCGLDSLKDLQQGLRNESPAERFDETDETFWNVVTEKYPYARAIYNAFKDDFNARLFIIVVSYGASSKIHFITKQELSPELIITRIDALIEASTIHKEIRPRWVEQEKKILNEKKDVIDSGNRFHDHLLMGYLFSIGAEFEKDLNERSVSDGLKEEFSAKGFELSKPTLSSTKENREWVITDEKRKYALKIDDETLNIYLKGKEDRLNSYISGKYIVPQCANPFGVWVYCADKDIYPLWEWLHDRFFFGGDKFYIIRIPENCDFNVSDFEVEKFALLTDNSCPPAFILSNTIHNCLKSILSCSNITISEILNSYDYIHIGAYKETFETPDYNKKIKQILSRTKELDEKSNLKFLFLNTFCRATSSTHASPAKLISALSPLAWVDCSLNIPEELASNFITNFYEEIETSLRNNKEANVVEIFLKTRKKMIIQGGFGLFGYIIKGNPHCKLKLAKVSCPSTASIVQ